MFDKIRKIFGKSKFIRKGSCKRCGTCCRNITLKIDKKFITEIYEFERLQEWQPRYNHFYISGQDEDGTLTFTCKSLQDNNLCKDYMIRSLFCRFYPILKSDMIEKGQKTLEGCGYYYEENK